MPELIDKKYLLAYLAGIKPDEYVSAFGEAAVQVIGLIEEFVKEMPTIEPEVRHGRWIVRGQEIYCSECNRESLYNAFGASKFSDFCPKCGARMDGGADNDSE
jgi:hypothetical protein